MRNVNVREALSCEDGTRHDLLIDYSWDAVTNEGWRSFNDPGLCGEPEIGTNPFVLTKIGPPPPPPAPPAPPPPPAPPLAAENPAPMVP